MNPNDTSTRPDLTGIDRREFLRLGGTLAAVGPLISAANAANLIVVGGAAAGTATVNVPAASFNGTTRLFPNAAFTSSGSVTFGPASVYNPQINGASAPSLPPDRRLQPYSGPRLKDCPADTLANGVRRAAPGCRWCRLVRSRR